jgi:hypothetical protein
VKDSKLASDCPDKSDCSDKSDRLEIKEATLRHAYDSGPVALVVEDGRRLIYKKYSEFMLNEVVELTEGTRVESIGDQKNEIMRARVTLDNERRFRVIAPRFVDASPRIKPSLRITPSLALERPLSGVGSGDLVLHWPEADLRERTLVVCARDQKTESAAWQRADVVRLDEKQGTAEAALRLAEGLMPFWGPLWSYIEVVAATSDGELAGAGSVFVVSRGWSMLITTGLLAVLLFLLANHRKNGCNPSPAPG